jgi:multicomponent Na+:H+ antiporter subunit E
LKRIFLGNRVIQFLFLLAFWLLLSGHYDVTHISMGIGSCLLVILLNHRFMKYHFYEAERDETEAKLKGIAPARIRIFRLLLYIPWLMWQIVVASLQVAYVVLHPKRPVDPSVIRFKTRLPNVASKVILGNSITLTPGTITIQIDGDEFLVHALMDVCSSGIVDGSLPTQVARLYEKKPGEVVSHLEASHTECRF